MNKTQNFSFQWISISDYIAKYSSSSQQDLSISWAKYDIISLLKERQTGFPNMQLEERADGWYVYDNGNFFDYIVGKGEQDSSSWIKQHLDKEKEITTVQKDVIRTQSEELSECHSQINDLEDKVTILENETMSNV